MKTVRALALAMIAVGLAACAQSKTAQNSDDAALAQISETAPETAADLMSPEELNEERQSFGVSDVFEKRTSDSSSSARLYILVDKANKGSSPTAQTMRVYLDGALIYNFLVSTGRETPEIAKSGRQYFSATPTGKFRIDGRYKDYVSKTWQAPMPYAQFFNGGIAIHATVRSHYAALGSRDSGGCVRLHNDNARIMWDLVAQV
ncbi:MAG: L,D-transpeptidase, partial [Proteobacteria bacterium]